MCKIDTFNLQKYGKSAWNNLKMRAKKDFFLLNWTYFDDGLYITDVIVIERSNAEKEKNYKIYLKTKRGPKFYTIQNHKLHKNHNNFFQII